MRLALTLLLAALTAGCSDSAPEADPAPSDTTTVLTPPDDAGRQSVADIVSTSPRLRTLARLLQASGLNETLADTSTAYTLFAPSDDAFAVLGDDAIAALEANPDAAREALLAHALPTRMLSVDVFPELSIESMAGTELAFLEQDGGLAVRSGGTTAQITDADLDADNGVVHVIDTVLQP
ncbi:fasciclin domain-containing protein [Rubrivirga marina]|uniref:FAS1 domain-containing protein n=1 Tax=Rubrivirga marina TaxID=1196024 RepID=A0A271J290_9BACT|nr:fasciclin domain-containing protein [Rubrivirga marina]PAP77470.1 hypothetical protein BSZ37_14005 [Rubrivirga marina]